MKRLRRLRAESNRSAELADAFIDSLRATFAHWTHADTHRLRTMVLRDLDLLAEYEDDND